VVIIGYSVMISVEEIRRLVERGRQREKLKVRRGKEERRDKKNNWESEKNVEKGRAK
jgi:hypothetical protein